MPRIRSIKPQFWLDERLGGIDRSARLLYIGLWNLSDDQGVFEWRPARIKVQLFPYDMDVNSGTIQQWLELLVTTGDVIQFNCNGGTFGYIPTFLKHQEIKKPSKWHYANIPDDIVPHQLPTILPLDTHQLPTSGEAVPIGSREEGGGSIIINNNINKDKNIGIIFQTFEENFQRITEAIKHQINDFVDTYGSDKVLIAMEKAIKQNKRSLAYIEGILEGHGDGKSRNNNKKDGDSQPDNNEERFRKQKFGHIVKS